MAGQTNFPTALDDNTSLYDVTDSVTSLVAAHHNNLKEAVKEIEKKIGIEQTTSPTSLDVRIGSPTLSHTHNGASGQAQAINASTILVPSGGQPSGLTLADHLMVPPRYLHHVYHAGSLPLATPNAFGPFSLPRTMQLEAIHGQLRRAPSGATTMLDVNVGPTSIFIASQGLRPGFAPGATSYRGASPNYMTFPSGVVITIDTDNLGSNDPGQDLTLTFMFRE